MGLNDSEGLNRVQAVLERHVVARTTPGAVGLVVRPDGVVARWAAGRHTYGEDAPEVRVDDLFDLASLTKVVVTTTLCMVLEEEGRLDLDAPVETWIPEFRGEGRDRVTPRHLLAHCSGLPAHIRFFETCQSGDQVLDAVCRVPLVYEPGRDTVYSDLGFLLLGAVVQRVGDGVLDGLAKAYVLEPLGMVETMYLPGEALRGRIPPTEVQAEHRGGLIHGEVHDGNTWAMGGVAPHAGLFGTAEDLGRFLRCMLCGGMLDGKRALPEAGIRRFILRAGMVPGSTRALGWDTVSAVGSSAGRYFSERSFGHTGFTGTTLWADPERDLGVVLLTNRVHPSRDNQRIRTLRPAFHDAVVEAVEK